MSEVEQVVSFLQRSGKGRLEYDRDWAASREGVERVLGELTLDFNQINIDNESSCARSAHISVQEEKEPSPDLLPNYSKTSYSPDSSSTRRINLNLSSEYVSRTTSSGLIQEKTKLYKKEMRMSLNSSLDNKRYQKSGPKTSDSFNTPEKFVRIRPVEVNVDRSMERNIDQKQFIFSPSSPHTSTTLLIEETEPVRSVNLSDSSLYQYTPGFLKKISKRNVSVNLVRLKLDSIRPFLNLEPEETKEEPEKEEEKVEEEEDDPEPELDKINKALINIREQMSAESERKTAELIKKLNMKSRELSEQAELRYQEEKEEERRIMKEQEEAILEEIKRDREDALRRENEEKAADLLRKHENDELLRICKEQEDKIREEEEREKRIIEQTDKYEKLILHQIKPTVLKLVDVYNSVPDPSKLSEASQDAIDIYDMFLTMVEDMKQKTRDGSANESDWENVISLENGVKSSILILEENILMLEQLAEKEKAEAEAAVAATKVKEAEEKAAAETATQAQQALKEVTEQKAEEVSTPAIASSPVIPSISVDAYRAEISDFKTKYIGDIVFSDQEKKIKSELMLAISTALNAISAQTTEHLNDKLEKLTLLLAGRPVVMKDTQICASQHPSGVKFCMAMAAKKIVRQGEEVVSSKAESAFPFASVALALWDSFPDFGKLLLAYFFEFCPLLVPYNPRRLEGQSDKDFYVALGYKYEKDVIEKQDKYLKRMTGLARLFAGIAASNKPQGSNTVHPFGPKLIWKFLAELMNQEPIPDVTATVLLVVLETTGNLMLIKYGTQFFKLLSFVNSCFLGRLEAVKTDGGPTARLQTYLEKTLKEGKVDPPKGVLAPGFVKKEALAVLLPLMDWLEKTKKEMAGNEAVSNEVVASAHIENHAMKLFLWADKEDRAANFNKNVVKAFYSSGMLFDVLTTFGELTPEVTHHKKYAKWKAAYIHNCLKNGETPVPGPQATGDDEDMFPSVPEGNDAQAQNTQFQPPPQDFGAPGAPYGFQQPPQQPYQPPQQPYQPQFQAAQPAVPVNPINNFNTLNIQPSGSGIKLSVEQAAKAQKYCKYAISSLDYDDLPTTILNLNKALHLCQTGTELQ